MLESQILSKIIQEGKIDELKTYNVDVTDFPTLAKAYTFIEDYIRRYGQAPDYRTVVAQNDKFTYMPDVTATIKYLCTELKEQSAKRRAYEFLTGSASSKYNELSGRKYVEFMQQEFTRLSEMFKATSDYGINYATNGEERHMWYKDSKENRTMQFIPTPYPSLTYYLGGGFELGDFLLLMAFTNRGKSWIASHIGITAWTNNFGVLHYSPELSRKQQSFRLDTLNGHFDNVKLRRGALGHDENRFIKYLEKFKANEGKAPYIIKTMEDLPQGLTLGVIEADLNANPNIQMVIIDGFNLMIHGQGGKMRDNMTSTSRRLRQVFGRYKVAGLVVHQTPGSAEKENGGYGETGKRILRPPRLTEYSETVAVIQDAATCLTFDAVDGEGIISIEKAREPHVGEIINLTCLFNEGYINEKDLISNF